jgi:beta-glucanase (GH16 family)
MMTWETILRTIFVIVHLLFLGNVSAQAGWSLTFSDEFDGNGVDETKWKRTDLWGNGTLAGNNERQCYLPANMQQQDGSLVLFAEPRKTPAADCHGAKTDLAYSSGKVSTAGCNQWEKGPKCETLKSFSQAYGYFEVRARLPRGRGLWPAFWLVPIDGAWPPEIDIMEFIGHETNKVYQTYHYETRPGERGKASGDYTGVDFTTSFNTFGLDWRPGLLVWYVNGVEVFRHAGPTVSSKPMYILLNLAVGGNWPGDPDRRTAFPARYEIDYVRVYQRVNDGQADDRPPFGVSK